MAAPTTNQPTSYDQLFEEISHMNPRAVKEAILHFEGPFKIDFTGDFLDKLPLNRLRHVLLAARVQQLKHNPPPTLNQQP